MQNINGLFLFNQQHKLHFQDADSSEKPNLSSQSLMLRFNDIYFEYLIHIQVQSYVHSLYH